MVGSPSTTISRATTIPPLLRPWPTGLGPLLSSVEAGRISGSIELAIQGPIHLNDFAVEKIGQPLGLLIEGGGTGKGTGGPPASDGCRCRCLSRSWNLSWNWG